MAWAGIGLIALHVLDDSFFQPEPGTSAGDHLVSGLVPLAVLLTLAWFYPRIRAGARAATALLLGALGIAMGAGEAVYYSLKVGPSGDDYTGFLALAAGIALVALGVVTLWRTRRTGDSLVRRLVRRLALGVGAVAVVFVFVLPFALSYVFTHASRPKVPPARLGAAHENVSFTTSDGLKLRGWYVPSKNGAAVVVFPGRTGTQRQARMLARHGYGALLFDRRGEAASEGDPNVFGWEFDKDLKAAAAFLKRRPDVDAHRIGGLGREDRQVSGGAGNGLALPSSAVISLGTAIFSNKLPPPSLTTLSGRIDAPVFFIYAAHGQGGEELNPKYYAAAHEPKTLWRVTEGKHTGGIEARPAEYERRVVGFFDEYLLKP